MAKVANAMTTYQAKGNREDLSDRIYNIDPFDTPGVSMIGRRNVKNRTFDWQTENLPAVDLNNAQEEGFELVRSPAVPTVRQTNLTQISKRDATVSASQEASDAAGKNSEMAHQMAIKSKTLKSDVESIAFSRQAQVSRRRDDGHPQDGEHSAPDRAWARSSRRAGHARLRYDDGPADGGGYRLGRSGRCAVHRGHARRCHGQGLSPMVPSRPG